MAELDENLERKTRELSNKDVEKGKEIQSFQEAQNHLLQIQSAQTENLQVERAISGAQAQNDQTMLQAAEIIANSNNGGGPVQGQEVQLNPQTLAILGKYGYGKPGTTTKSNSNQQNIGGKVVINNTTETKTVNKLQQITTPPANVKKIFVPGRSQDSRGSMQIHSAAIAQTIVQAENHATSWLEPRCNRFQQRQDSARNRIQSVIRNRRRALAVVASAIAATGNARHSASFCPINGI